MKGSKGQGCFRKFMTQSSQFLEIYSSKKYLSHKLANILHIIYTQTYTTATTD